MRFSLNFIKEILEIKEEPQVLAQLLTMAGMEVEHFEKMNNDWVFDIEVTTNRYDWLSLLGIAREIAACLHQKIKIDYPGIIKKPLLKERKVIIENQHDCFFYAGRVVRGVVVVDSPQWLQERVLHCGITPVNNVVDITNYCMLKWGNPLHAFDEDKIEGNVIIRRAKAGEQFLGIDDKERVLTPDNLVIADEKKVLALAGVIGAKNSEITNTTCNVFLESAVFSPVIIRISRRSAGMNTDASYRFERRVDYRHGEYAAASAVQLMSQIANGVLCGYIEEGKKQRLSRTKIKVNLSSLSAYLGESLSAVQVKKILSSLDFKTITASQEQIVVIPPEFRADIEKEVDVYEEVSRIYGYDKIQPQLPFLLYSSFHALAVSRESRLYQFKKELRNFLVREGLQEIITYSIEGEEELTALGEKDFIALANPLRSQENVLRTTTFPGMMKAIRRNLNRNQSALRFFEIAHTYSCGSTVHGELPKVAVALSGDLQDFFFLKGVVERIFGHINEERFSLREESKRNFTNALAIIFDDKEIGFLGKADEKICRQFDCKEDVFFAEIDINSLIGIKKDKKYKPFSSYPVIWRDISLALQKNKRFKEIETVLYEEGKDVLSAVKIVDYYKGKDIPDDYCAFTLRIFYQSPERTLTAQEVDALHVGIRDRLHKENGVLIR